MVDTLATTQMWDLLIRPRDPLVLRDARPFTADPGARAFSLEWPLPSTIAGALRTHIGSAAGVDWAAWKEQRGRNGQHQEHPVQRLEFITGLRADRAPMDQAWRVGFPAPADALAYREGETDSLRITRLRPGALQEGEGCNLPRLNGQQLLPILVETAYKPVSAGAFWSLAATVDWLLGKTELPPASERWSGLPEDTRVHVSIDREKLTFREGHLFATTGRAFGPAVRRRTPEAKGREDVPETAILCQVRGPEALRWQAERAFIPIGGERRQARLEPEPVLATDPWAIPEALVHALAGQRRFRLQLVTPAIFRDGWRPGWLTPRRDNEVPEPLRDVPLTLRAMVAGRRVAISGWDVTHHCEKPLRYAVPAGSVLFFESSRPLTLDEVRRLWLLPISDGARNRREGFGLAIPGVWTE
ncbi:MAG: CRISPR-associated protein Cmr3 [Thermomicrobiales bacterium]|nr:MAG: CRISPR-associated protein Cmr3 [Thermomicrobiales bacterium]